MLYYKLVTMTRNFLLSLSTTSVFVIFLASCPLQNRYRLGQNRWDIFPIFKKMDILKQICTNLQINILLDNYVMTSGKILKKSLPESVFIYWIWVHMRSFEQSWQKSDMSHLFWPSLYVLDIKYYNHIYIHIAEYSVISNW